MDAPRAEDSGHGHYYASARCLRPPVHGPRSFPAIRSCMDTRCRATTPSGRIGAPLERGLFDRIRFSRNVVTSPTFSSPSRKFNGSRILFFFFLFHIFVPYPKTRGKIIVREISIIYRVLGVETRRRTTQTGIRRDVARTRARAHKNRQRVIEKNANSLRGRNKKKRRVKREALFYFILFFH